MTESFDWFLLAQAAFIIAMIFYILPGAKRMWKESPKGSRQDWLTFTAIIGGIALFIYVLITMVKG
ncbi:MAG: hypothetical protein AB8D52_00245 [Gammaproteobacteria bacterium]